MVAEPKYLAKIELALSAPAGANAAVSFAVVEGQDGVEGVDFDGATGTVEFVAGATSGLITVVTRHPYIGQPRDFVVQLSSPVNCQLGETEKTVWLPGIQLRTLFHDTFTAADGTLIGHQPDIGQPWAYLDETSTVPVVILGNKVHFAKQLPTTSYIEWLYPHSGGSSVNPDFATSQGMGYNGARDRIWAVTRFDYYTETEYDQVTSEAWVFQEVDPATGEVRGYVPKPNHAVIPRDPVASPSPVCDERVNSGNIVYDATDTAMWLASTALGDSNGTFPRHLWKWSSSTADFVLAAKPITEGQLIMKFDPIAGGLWAITSVAANVGSAAQLTNNVVKINKSTGLVDTSLALTFNGLDPATTSRVAPAQLAWSFSGRMFCITEVNGSLGSALASDDIARTLFEVNPTTGATTPLANLNGQGRFFTDMLYDANADAIVLFAVDDTAFTGSEYMYRYTLGDSTLSLVATLPGPNSATTFAGSGGDKSKLPLFQLDSYQNLIWYYPREAGAVDNIVALDKNTGALAFEIHPVSVLDPGNLTYANQGGTNIVARPDAVFFNLWASDGADPGSSLYDSRGAILKVVINRPDGQAPDVRAKYVSPAFPGAGTYSVKATISNPVGSVGGLSVYCYSETNSTDFGGFGLDFENNNVLISTNTNGDVPRAFDLSTLPSSFLAEMRWDMDGTLRSLYLDGTLVHSLEEVAASGNIDLVEFFVSGLTSIEVDDVVVTQGGPGAEALPVAPAPLAWYAFGSPWSSWNAAQDSDTSVGAYPGNGPAGRIIDSPAGEIFWDLEWLPVVGSESTNPPALMYPYGPDPQSVPGPDVNWAWGAWIDPSALAGEMLGEMRLRALVNGVKIPGYLWNTWADGPQSYADLAWGYSPTDPRDTMRHTRDDFKGANTAPILAQVPNVTTDSAAWRDGSSGPDGAFFRQNGTGRAEVVAGTDPGSYGKLAYAFLDLPAGKSFRLDFVLRSVSGGALATSGEGGPAFGKVFGIELRSTDSGENIIARLDSYDGGGIWSAMTHSNMGNSPGHEFTSGMPGNSGAPVKFTIEWANSTLTMWVNGQRVDTMSTFQDSGNPGNPAGPGYLYLEVAKGNFVEYVDVLQALPT